MQHSGLQQQSNRLQRDMQQRVQASGQVPGTMLQAQNEMDQQKQLYQSQRRPLPQTSSTSLHATGQTGHATGGDLQEEIYHKIKVMKEMYLPELSEMYSKIAKRLQQQDSLPQQSKLDQLDKLQTVKTMLEHFMSVLQLQIPKHIIQPGLKDKLVSYEKQIVTLISKNRPRRQVPSMQQGQLPPPHMHSMQQSRAQITQVQSHENENQMNPQMQSMNMQPSAMQQNSNMASLQQNWMSSLSAVSTVQHNMMNSLQPGSNMDSGHGVSLHSLQQVAAGSIQQTPVSAPPRVNTNTLSSSQGGANLLRPNMSSLQSNYGMLQPQIKQQDHHHLKQQFQQRQIQQHKLLQQKQMLQQKQQQLPGQLQANQHQMSQVHQNNDVNELKMRQGMGAKPGVFQQPLSGGQRACPRSQSKSGSAFPISSTYQHLQAASPQISQHSSPQVDRQSLLAHPKAGTPLQTASSPFVIPSPSTPMAPSPMPADLDKPSSLSNAGNIAHKQTTGVDSQALSPAIGTPGISASPLFAEFSVPDGTTHVNALSTISGNSGVMEQPIERLIKAVKSISSNALSTAVSDIGSAVTMIDRIAGPATGHGSRAAVGEDLAAMTKFRLQARNVMTHDGANVTGKMRRYTSAVPLTSPETSDLESTATYRIKRRRTEADHELLEEIREINLHLINTVVDISDEGGREGTIVKCSFNAVALSANLKSQYGSEQISLIQPLRLLVPTNYPRCSPILLDKFPAEVSKEHQDLFMKAKSRFSISLRSISQPMSIGDIARTWDVCARAIISEHAQQSGGGSFSSKYGTWEDCLSAA